MRFLSPLHLDASARHDHGGSIGSVELGGRSDCIIRQSGALSLFGNEAFEKEKKKTIKNKRKGDEQFRNLVMLR